MSAFFHTLKTCRDIFIYFCTLEGHGFCL